MFSAWTIVGIASLLFMNAPAASAGDDAPNVEITATQNPARVDTDLARRIHDLQIQLDQQQSRRDQRLTEKQLAPKSVPMNAQRPADAGPFSDGQELLRAQRLLKAQRLLDAARERDRAQHASHDGPQTSGDVVADSAAP